MKSFKTYSIIIFVTIFILVFLEICFYFGRIYLNKNNVGFLLNYNKSTNEKIEDKCQRIKHITNKLYSFS